MGLSPRIGSGEKHGVHTRSRDAPLSGRTETLTGFRNNVGAGEGIRTLDPNLGKVVLYP